MLGIDLIDWLVLAGYLLVILAVGTLAVRWAYDSASYVIDDRRFGKLMMIFFSFGTGTHSDQAVSVVAKSYRVGMSGILLHERATKDTATSRFPTVGRDDHFIG